VVKIYKNPWENPGKYRTGPPPKSGTMAFVSRLNTTIYSRNSVRYKVYMET